MSRQLRTVWAALRAEVPEEAGREPPKEPELEPEPEPGVEMTEATALLLGLEESEPEPVSEEVAEVLVLVDLALLSNFVMEAGRVAFRLKTDRRLHSKG